MKIMKQICRKGTAIILTLLMMLALVPQYAYASPYGAAPRSSLLDLTGEVVSYTASGGTENADPTEGNIIDSVEGWKWYLNGDEEKGYEALTLEMSGINLVTKDSAGIKLPGNATIVLVNNTENIVKSIFNGSGYTYGIQCMGNLTIKGDSGVLTATGGDTDSAITSGVMAGGALSIQGGNITAVGGDAGVISTGLRASQTITITGGTIYARTGDSQASHAVYSGSEGLSMDGMEAYQKVDEDYTAAASVWNGILVFANNLAANDVRITPLLPASFEGQGTEAAPYLITSKGELKEMAQLVNDQNGRYGNKYYKLTTDIVLNEDITGEPEVWTPIGQDSDTCFTGVFDGSGHTISGIYIDDTFTYAGLFGYMKFGTVKNVKVGGGQIDAAVENSYAGGIAAYNGYGRIEDCSNTADVRGSQSGGIVGYNSEGHIQDCSNSGRVEGIVAGGITGANIDAPMTVVNCFNTGIVMAIKGNQLAYAGGIAGVNMASSIKNCYSTGNVTSDGPSDAIARVGGIFGSSHGGTIDHAYWLDSSLSADTAVRYNNVGSEEAKTSAEIKALTQTLNDNVADLKDEYSGLSPWKADTDNQNGGYPVFGTMIASFSGQGTEAAPYLITSKEELKKMAQLVNKQNSKYGDKHYRMTTDIVLNEDISEDSEDWTPIGENSDAPFSGVFDGGSRTITGLYIDSSVSYAGLFGYVKFGTVKNVGLEGGQIEPLSGNSYVGGIAGYNRQGTIKDCFNTSNVTGTQSGGIAGYNRSGHIQNCSNSGRVVGIAAGGITGVNVDAPMTVVNCFNTGAVMALKGADIGYAGGIAGINMVSSIKNCYSTGDISIEGPSFAVGYAGGIFGRSDGGIIDHAYWLDSSLSADTAVSYNNVGSEEVKTSAEIKALTQTLNDNVADLKDEYSGLSPWKADTDNQNSGYPLFDKIVSNYTLTVSGGGIGATAGGSFAAGTEVPINAGTKEGYTFTDWTSSGGGSFTNKNLAETIFTMPDQSVTITAAWVQNGSDSGSSGGHVSSGKSDNANTANIVVNGKAQSAGKSETVTGADGKTTTTVTVDSDKLKSLLSAEKNGAKVTIPVADSASTAEGRLTGEMVKSMEDKRATLIIQRGASSYTLPAAEINISEISRQLGTSVSLSDITVSVKISEPSNAMAKMVETAEQSKGFTVVAPAVDFTITCTYGGKSVTSSSFNAYVERTIAIPAGVDPSKITTGIVVEPNGTVYHVPTRVTVIDGKYYAVINSLTNSTYSVIWNPVTFSDMTNHWAKDSVNNMGSRMVVTGVGNNNYAPGRNMTRAEFSAVIVRALGLAPASGASNFSDIKTSDWYNGYIETAVSYGIIKGYDNGKFGPNDTITREQAMTMLARAMKVTGLNADLTDKNVSELIGAYTDGTAVSAYAKESVAACLETGITAGRSNQIIAPKDSITRAEVAIMAERLLKKSDLI
ncbi:S-layer homology domain-containing protein [Clostridium aminobutyricum]|uniref:S-layer homology domain-containing protein n=1 Tax=Clostridium aminobutyricum TaxID=33953 RepID=A0A939D8U3_CLOAM|nr:S-layer homology domain-containing protein [Clostridium aminobutyricum]MBN7773539.1 S-layer homology domain-containing protein [Clostridium aminobutyricum]